MDITQDLNKELPSFTKLNDRILWIDGDSTYTAANICDLLIKGYKIEEGIYVDKTSDEIDQFNKLSKLKISTKSMLKNINIDWNIPEEYLNIDIHKYIFKKFLNMVESGQIKGSNNIILRYERIEKELQLYEKYDLLYLIKTIIYIIEEFNKNNVVWGTGRGSSCCSYILYVIGLHEVDSVEYNLSLDEFFR
jgi:DNA polymerase III alpha subunit